MEKWEGAWRRCLTRFSLITALLTYTTQFTHLKYCLVAKLCLTLCEPVNYSLPGSSVHGISQARTLEWVAISFPRGSSPPRDTNLSLLHWQVDFFLPLSHLGSPHS